jgi:hypothetical protein
MVIARYAESRGIPMEEAMTRYLPALKAKARNPLVAKSLDAVRVLTEIKGVSEGADPVTKQLLATLAGDVVGRSMGGGGEGDPVDEAVKDVVKYAAKIKAIDAAFGRGDTDTIKEELQGLKNQIANQKKSEEIQALMDKIDEAVGPLKERLDTMEEGKGSGATPPPPPPPSPEDLFTQISDITERAKGWLDKAGYKVEMDKGLSKEEIQKMIDEASKAAIEKIPQDQLKDKLEKAGYKIVGGPVTYEQAQKMAEEAAAKAHEDALDDKRIEAVENIIHDGIVEVVNMFKPAVEFYYNTILPGKEGQPSSAPSGSPEKSA